MWRSTTILPDLLKSGASINVLFVRLIYGFMLNDGSDMPFF
jgi:hypothetical protein